MKATAVLQMTPRTRRRVPAPLGSKEVPPEALVIRLPQVCRLLGGVSAPTALNWLTEAVIIGRKLPGMEGRFYSTAEVRAALRDSGITLERPVNEEGDDGSASR